MNINELLMQEWEEIKEELKYLDSDKQKDVYNTKVKRLTDIEQRLVDLEKNKLDNDTKVKIQEIEAELKDHQLSEEKKSQLNKNVIEILKVGLPIVGAFTMGIISMRWEKLDTLTSSAGKASLRDSLRFK